MILRWCLAFLLISFEIQAEGNFPSCSIRGFGTLSMSGTDTDRLGFRRDTTQANGIRRSPGIDNDSRLGLQLDVDFTDFWHAGLQWVARDHAGDFFEQNLEWAYLRWRPSNDIDIRIGRLGFNVFMLSDYRNVGYAYLWARPPHEFYGNLIPYHFDGADLTWTFPTAAGQLTLKGYGGHSFMQLPIQNVKTLDLQLALAGATMVYEQGDWQFRLGYAYSQTLDAELDQYFPSLLASPALNAVWPGARSLLKEFSLTRQKVHFGSIGLSYDDGVWVAQTEAMYLGSNLKIYPDTASAYLSLGRRIGGVTPYILLSIAETPVDHVAIPELPQSQSALVGFRNQIDNVVNNNGIDQKSVSLGLRWDLYENIALKAQWSHFWLGQNGTQLWIEPRDFGPTPREVNTWTLGFDFLF